MTHQENQPNAGKFIEVEVGSQKAFMPRDKKKIYNLFDQAKKDKNSLQYAFCVLALRKGFGITPSTKGLRLISTFEAKLKSRKHLTEQQKTRIQELVREDKPNKFIASVIGVPHYTVSNYIYKHGIKLRSTEIAGLDSDEYFDLMDRISAFALYGSEQALENLRAKINENLKRRYSKGSMDVKYGNLNRNFTEDELLKFFNAVEDPKYLLLFKLQATLGLRIGEAVRIKVSDINRQTRELMILTEKARKLDRLALPDWLYYQIGQYVNKNLDRINGHKEYLFFPDRPCNWKYQHIRPEQARKIFRAASKKAGIQKEYGATTENYHRHGRRNLYLLSTHSLRHFAITRMWEQTKDLKVVNAFARHSPDNLEDTSHYIGTNRTAVYDSIRKFTDIAPDSALNR